MLAAVKCTSRVPPARINATRQEVDGRDITRPTRTRSACMHAHAPHREAGFLRHARAAPPNGGRSDERWRSPGRDIIRCVTERRVNRLCGLTRGKRISPCGAPHRSRCHQRVGDRTSAPEALAYDHGLHAHCCDTRVSLLLGANGGRGQVHVVAKRCRGAPRRSDHRRASAVHGKAPCRPGGS